MSETPREPDRFDKQAWEIAARYSDVLASETRDLSRAIAERLRAAESSALERAAQEIRALDLDHIGALEGSREATRRVILDRLEQGDAWRHPCACEKHRSAAIPARTPDLLREAGEYCPLRKPYIAATARIAELESALIPPAAAPAAEPLPPLQDVDPEGTWGAGYLRELQEKQRASPAVETGKAQRYVCVRCGREAPGNAPCPHCRAAPPAGEGT